MNNPLLYPFLAICCILAFGFGVWCWFAIKSARDRRRAAGVSEYQRISKNLHDFLTAPRPAVESAPMYQHKGHRHGARRRGPNRAAFRAKVARLLARAQAVQS